MRIIAGEFKGRTLAAPKGIVTRPTTDRVRESLMSAIGSARGGFDDAVVLDAFAGSGALGLEALSRGAASVHFYEINAAALRALSANVAALNVLPAAVIVHRCDVLKAPPTRQQQPFDLVFLDPPYALESKNVMGLIAALDAAAVLADGSLICYEHDKGYEIDFDSDDGSAAFFPHFDIISHKVYGDTAIDILRKEPS